MWAPESCHPWPPLKPGLDKLAVYHDFYKDLVSIPKKRNIYPDTIIVEEPGESCQYVKKKTRAEKKQMFS